ncbi:hypothetical protein [Flavobacterium branchiophilum]|uniref:hypothetical protein n=1 Tax=Flavobacterium branchiophilum TaxID=55197 RepID=UPI0002E4598C
MALAKGYSIFPIKYNFNAYFVIHLLKSCKLVVLVCSPIQKVGSPTKKLGLPIKKVGSPTQKVGSPTKKVGSPTQKVGSPTQKVGSPTKKVGRPTQKVGQPDLINTKLHKTLCNKKIFAKRLSLLTKIFLNFISIMT